MSANIRNQETPKEERLYLSELLVADKVPLVGQKNVLIKSPTGSGKTETIVEYLSPQYSGKKLLLVSTSMLEDELGLEEGITKLKNISSKSNSTEDIILMTYASFGSRITFDDKFLEGVEVIFCDEIHSLFDYYGKHNNRGNYSAAIKTLHQRHENIDIFYFTATDDKIKDFINKKAKNLYKDITVIDYMEDKDIVRYKEMYSSTFSGLDGIMTVVDSLQHFTGEGKKGIIFNEKIATMKAVEEYLTSRGYKTISIWSIKNEDNPMNEEQLRVRSELMETKKIPEGYDFLIINEAMREGWNLKDPNVELVILNTLDKTNQKQARGRVRKDITFLLTRVPEESVPITERILRREKSLGVIKRNLGKQLTSADKEQVAKDLGIRREENNVLVKWNTIKKALLMTNKYKIEDKVVKINGKNKAISIITDIAAEEVLPAEDKAKKFVRKLVNFNFGKKNKEFLDGYIKKDSRIAFSHISKGHVRLVSNNGWSERKYADITYLLAKDKKLFSLDNYIRYSDKYDQDIIDIIDVLKERAKYEPYAQNNLCWFMVKRELEEKRVETELLDYIYAQNYNRNRKKGYNKDKNKNKLNKKERRPQRTERPKSREEREEEELLAYLKQFPR